MAMASAWIEGSKLVKLASLNGNFVSEIRSMQQI
jgi:hypothetical protein